MPLILISSDRFVEHQTPPGHPEGPERAEVMRAVAAQWGTRGGEVAAPRPAAPEQLGRRHGADYHWRLSGTGGNPVELLHENYNSAEAHYDPQLAAGYGLDRL